VVDIQYEDELLVLVAIHVGRAGAAGLETAYVDTASPNCRNSAMGAAADPAAGADDFRSAVLWTAIGG
jgi:hypothetical protein